MENQRLEQTVQQLQEPALFEQAPINSPAPDVRQKNDSPEQATPPTVRQQPRQTGVQRQPHPPGLYSAPKLTLGAIPSAGIDEIQSPATATPAVDIPIPDTARLSAPPPSTALTLLPVRQPAPALAVPYRVVYVRVLPALQQIKPVRPERGRWLAGVHATAAMADPGKPASPWFTGAGLHTEFRAISNLWVTAGIDRLSASVHTADTPATWFFSDKLPKVGWHDELTGIEANPQQVHLKLGIRYVLPVRFWMQPSVQITHTWLRNNPGIYSFTYEDTHHHNTTIETIAVRGNTRFIQNNWSMGIALDRKITRDWSFRISASWLEGSSASAPNFDAWWFQTGVQYGF